MAGKFKLTEDENAELKRRLQRKQDLIRRLTGKSIPMKRILFDALDIGMNGLAKVYEQGPPCPDCGAKIGHYLDCGDDTPK